MKIPNKIRIGNHIYNIKKVWAVNLLNQNIVGQINYGSKEIKLKEFKQDDRINQDNFFHELSHGILKELEFNHPKVAMFRRDESFVQEMGLNLRKTFLDLLAKQEKEK